MSSRLVVSASSPLSGALHGGSKIWNQTSYDLTTVEYLKVTLSASPEAESPANLLLHAVSTAERAEELLSIYSTGPQRRIALYTDGEPHTYLIDVTTLRVDGGERAAAHLVFAPMDVSGEFVLHDIELLHEPDYHELGPLVEDVILETTYRPSIVFGGGDSELRVAVDILNDSRLHLATGRREGSPAANFEVDIDAGSGWESLLKEEIESDGWAEHAIDLARFRGQQLGLRFRMSSTAGGRGVYYVGSPLIAERAPDSPLVIVYVVDTLRADHLSVYGYPKPTSPNLEAFARGATVFDRCYSQASWTKPSVTSLFTGLAPDAHRAGEHGQALSVKVPSLGRLFARAGFVTASVIANTNAGWSSNLHLGFDRVIDQNRAREGSDARAMNATLESILERHRDEPLLLYAHLVDPHTPYEDPEGWATHFESGRSNVDAYDGEIRYMDEAFGSFVEGLDETGASARATIVFTSDHGENFRDGLARAHGETLEQAETRVPLIVFDPRVAHRGERIATNVQLVDVLPTLLALYGIERPPMDGRSFVDLLAGRRGSRDIAFSHSSDAYQPEPTTAVWRGMNKLYSRGDGTYAFVDLTSDRDDDSRVFRPKHAFERLLSIDEYEELERLSDDLGRYLARPAGAAEAARPELDADTMEQLRALGYVP